SVELDPGLEAHVMERRSPGDLGRTNHHGTHSRFWLEPELAMEGAADEALVSALVLGPREQDVTQEFRCQELPLVAPCHTAKHRDHLGGEDPPDALVAASPSLGVEDVLDTANVLRAVGRVEYAASVAHEFAGGR